MYRLPIRLNVKIFSKFNGAVTAITTEIPTSPAVVANTSTTIVVPPIHTSTTVAPALVVATTAQGKFFVLTLFALRLMFTILLLIYKRLNMCMSETDT